VELINHILDTVFYRFFWYEVNRSIRKYS